MIPIQLTENHFVNPEAIAHVWCNPKTAGDRSAVCIIFTDRDRIPLELYGAEAEEAGGGQPDPAHRHYDLRDS